MGRKPTASNNGAQIALRAEGYSTFNETQSPESQHKMRPRYRFATVSPSKAGQNCGKQRALMLGKWPSLAKLPGTRARKEPALDLPSQSATSN